jgi:hypothetical protein
VGGKPEFWQGLAESEIFIAYKTDEQDEKSGSDNAANSEIDASIGQTPPTVCRRLHR